MELKHLKKTAGGFICRPPLTVNKLDAVLRLIDHARRDGGKAYLQGNPRELERLQNWANGMIEYKQNAKEINEFNVEQWVENVEALEEEAERERFGY